MLVKLLHLSFSVNLAGKSLSRTFLKMFSSLTLDFSQTKKGRYSWLTPHVLSRC